MLWISFVKMLKFIFFSDMKKLNRKISLVNLKLINTYLEKKT